MTNVVSSSPSGSGSSPERRFAFPKSSRILKAAEFRRTYDKGLRISGPYFTAFCLKLPDAEGPRVGLTTPRALGNAVVRNRIKRRLRECVRKELWRVPAGWRIVINPRRSLAATPMAALQREIERLFERCNKS